jgi:hypothetical protein
VASFRSEGLDFELWTQDFRHRLHITLYRSTKRVTAVTGGVTGPKSRPAAARNRRERKERKVAGPEADLRSSGFKRWPQIWAGTGQIYGLTPLPCDASSAF